MRIGKNEGFPVSQSSIVMSEVGCGVRGRYDCRKQFECITLVPFTIE